MSQQGYTKCKLKLIQPTIKCAGRSEVECYYRGYILRELEHGKLIKFKYKGEEIVMFYHNELGFLGTGYKDIKLI